ncbi:hypothetical protein AOL_s00176g19 [Orbilia oligospora ATCC 24927]|uniref:DUF7918 domain-containing protein n=1 Tax=Arthrobotrys oligospora (strain ATCC 24927 / CBS 115.81 / DSM 1491) TaxID=756982 RepID=G1XPP5_ARTOA|nr:hypothetical protein AOL_s00176g19 [Orbilia oligospora ATCC 24927]EGX44848.1 hypothetical protein AOL_s00176g19 [Orbilia oligospora ATCC 24927]
MPTNKDFTCDLYIDGSKATEHNIATDNDTCTAWIVAEEGKTYRLKIDASGTKASQYKVHFRADGVSLRQLYLTRSDAMWISTIEVERTADGSTVTCPLLFQNLNVEENDSKKIEAREEVIGNIGKLELSIWRVTISDIKSGFQEYEYKLEAAKVIKEKLLKGQAVSHCTNFGERTTEPPKKHLYCGSLLQAQGYIPRTPSPELIDEDLSDLTQEELRREVMRLREQNADIKREVKQEHDSQTPGKAKNNESTYIDLTGDDD